MFIKIKEFALQFIFTYIDKSKKAEKEPVPKWQKSLTISKRNSDDAFHSVTSVALHPSGDISLVDKNNKVADLWSSNRGSPRVYGFHADGSPKFVLNSTDKNEEPVGELVNAQGIAVSADGNYLVVDGTTIVKVFHADGQYSSSFTTLSEDSPKGIRASASCITVNASNGDVLVGDYHREMITVHDGGSFKIKKEVHVGLKPVHIAVNAQNQILVTVLFQEPAEVVATNLFFLVLKQNQAGGKVVAFDYDGDEVFTIVPVMSGELAKPFGVAYDSDGGLYVALSKFDLKSRMTKPNTGHIHYYNGKGEFVKCVVKGLHWPLGIALRKDVLAVADNDNVKVFKPE